MLGIRNIQLETTSFVGRTFGFVLKVLDRFLVHIINFAQRKNSIVAVWISLLPLLVLFFATLHLRFPRKRGEVAQFQKLGIFVQPDVEVVEGLDQQPDIF